MPQIKILTTAGAFDVELTQSEKNDTDLDIDNPDTEFVQFGQFARINRTQLVGYININTVADVLEQRGQQNDRANVPSEPPGRQGGF